MARDVATIEIYDEIGSSLFGDGVTPSSVSRQVAAAGDVRRLDVRINSPGGVVTDGVAIYNILKQAKAPVRVYVDGVAASIASIIAMAGEQIVMGEGALMMIHHASGLAIGTAADMRQLADVLQKMDEQMADIYAARTDSERDAIVGMMDDETWMSADEAIEAGFATRKVGEREKRANVVTAIHEDRLRALGFKKMPDSAYRFLNEWRPAASTRVSSGDGLPRAEHQPEEVSLMAEDKTREGTEQAAEAGTEETTTVKTEPTASELATVTMTQDDLNARIESKADEKAKAALKAERERCAQITAKAKEMGFASMAQRFIDEGTDVRDAIDALKDAKIESFQKGSPQVGPDPEEPAGAVDRDRRMAERALAIQKENPGMSLGEATIRASKEVK